MIPDDPFRFLIHEIIEQMLSVKVGAIIFSRLEALCGEITPGHILLQTPELLRSTGMSTTKVEYIQIIAHAVRSGSLCLEELAGLPDEEVFKALTSIRGIGPWTAKMYLLFVLNRQNVLPVEDVAFQQSYRWLYKTVDVTPAAIMKKCQKWKPHSSIAARYLYRALDMGLTKTEFHLYKTVAL